MHYRWFSRKPQILCFWPKYAVKPYFKFSYFAVLPTMVWNFLLSDIKAMTNNVNYENKPYWKSFRLAECYEERRVLDRRKNIIFLTSKFFIFSRTIHYIRKPKDKLSNSAMFSVNQMQCLYQRTKLRLFLSSPVFLCCSLRLESRQKLNSDWRQ
jgi:hypothetical protein